MYTSKTESKYRSRFVRQYAGQLEQMVERIKRKEPDFILAISRSGPRLLELLSDEGIYSIDTPVISEKALELMPPHLLNQSNIVVFDDVTNTGKTITRTQMEIESRFDPESINPITFGYDTDTSIVDEKKWNHSLS